MANIIDYMEWRGDLTFSQSHFNDVDNLIMSVLSYIDFSDVVTEEMLQKSITIKMAAEKYFDLHAEDRNINPLVTIRNAPAIFERMAKCRRFANVRLTKYVNYIDTQTQTQFSAICAILDLEHIYVSFRGTDDTLIGWKEDFNMSFMDAVPSQKEAVTYLEEVSYEWDGKIILGGHSKGGNLAVYSGIYCSNATKEKIISIYTNDGPGFREEIITSNKYRKMSSKIKSIVPESSIIGMLFYHTEKYSVIKSTKKGLMQHDPISWEVMGNDFVTVKKRSQSSIFLDKTLSNWLESLEADKREEFVDALFGILDGAKVHTVSELSEQGMKLLPIVMKTYLTLDEQTRKMMVEIVKALIKSADSIIKDEMKEVKQE